MLAVRYLSNILGNFTIPAESFIFVPMYNANNDILNVWLLHYLTRS